MIRLKNRTQLEGIRRSCRLLAEVFDLLEPLVVPGISTKELDEAAEKAIRDGGGEPAFLGYMGYPASICASVNEVVIHGIPNGTKLKEGDIISIDMGINLSGYYSDRALTLPVGRIDQKKQKLMDITRECLDIAISKAVAGNRIKDISRAVFEHADSAGYGVVRDFCGHGTGIELHEEPQVPNYVGRGPNPRLKPGMVIALEPMINQGTHEVVILDDDWTVVTADRKPSAHFEHTVAILEDGTEILTRPRT
ncbi:type I methionyl aminopeptidase [Marispirochaeta aestuarii]|uniref:Methionine aminopeptidase n=1 Tax=Marispirochaeta aestuarii TaxID=1963862 RepID=A0A1Y1S1F8_9SPIO|nr:type I methionyl aminopeptidase [Marispirochaeta aestuarii]ORC37330.1 type I methionyl aminopeptidase [Marispirochaeta aestuarii]